MNDSYAVLSKLLNKRFRSIHHALYIFLIVFFWFLFDVMTLESVTDVIKMLLYASTYLTIAYLNIYVLFERYLLQGKTVSYILISLLTFITSYILQKFIYFNSWDQLWIDLKPTVPNIANMLINTITYCMFIGVGLSVRMLKLWIQGEQKINTLEQENLKATLNNLKSQISPHFLFNTFNNLYVLTKTDPKIASEMILGFSDLMRYQLDESEKEKVCVDNEISYIINFLKLEKLRKDNLDLQIFYNKHAHTGLMVEPLLFATLVENAVKHGSQKMARAFIHIIICNENDHFSFKVTNSKPEVSKPGKEESLKKGLDNLKKRLSLAYPSKHSLEIIDNRFEFIAKLRLKLT